MVAFTFMYGMERCLPYLQAESCCGLANLLPIMLSVRRRALPVVDAEPCEDSRGLRALSVG